MIKINLNAKLRKIERILKDLNSDIWYEMDWSNFSKEDRELLRTLAESDLRDIPKDILDQIFEKVQVKRAYPKFPVPKNSLAYMSVEKVEEMQKTFPNVKL